MKKIIVAMALAAFATGASAAIASSSHDLTTLGGGSSCAYCHMPHNGSAAAGAPLWARNITTVASYNVYTSVVTGHAVPSQPGAGSRSCLSCHDGTQALSVVFQSSGVGTKTAGTAAVPAMTSASPAFVGTTLTSDHPVGVTYTTTSIFGLTATPPAAFNVAMGQKLECSSCHNAHSGKNFAAGGASSYPQRQFMANYNGDFCVGCHSAK
jgi:hypothetical protein